MRHLQTMPHFRHLGGGDVSFQTTAEGAEAPLQNAAPQKMKCEWKIHCCGRNSDHHCHSSQENPCSSETQRWRAARDVLHRLPMPSGMRTSEHRLHKMQLLKHLGVRAGLTRVTAPCFPSAISEVWPFLASLPFKLQRNPAVPLSTTCMLSPLIATRPAVQLLTSHPSDLHLLSWQLHLIVSPATDGTRHQNCPPRSEPVVAAVMKEEVTTCSVHNLGNPTSGVSQWPRASLSAATQPSQNSAWNQILPNTASRPEPAGRC